MTRRLLGALLLGATLAFAPSLPARASGVPAFDGAAETIVWGRARPTDPVVRGKARTRGKWTEVAGSLRPDPTDAGEHLWLPEADAGRLADGMVRLRIQTGKRLDAGLLLRVGDDLDALSGYELTLDRGMLRLLRHDDGTVLPIGEEVKVRRLDRRPELEVVVYMVGPQLLVTVYDGASFEHLATLAAHETTYRTGRIGVRAGAKAEGIGVTLLSTSRSGDPSSVRNPKFARRYGPDASKGTTPFGNTRFAYVPVGGLASVPADLRPAEQGRVATPGGELAILFLDTTAFERLRRSGAEIAAVDSNVPWKHLDPSFHGREGKAPTPQGRGFRLDQSYKDAAMVEGLLQAYAAKYPDLARLVEIGRTHQGRAIWGLKISDRPADEEAEPSVLLSGGHHASELLAVEYPLDAAARLLEDYGRDPRVTRWVDDLEIFVVPLVNPDGNAMFVHASRFVTRKNGRDSNLDGVHDPFEGVDLNRNYPFGWGQVGSSGRATSRYYRGMGPASEPETAAMMALADAQHFAAAISFHTVGSAVFSPYALEGVRSPEPDEALAIAKDMVAAAPAIADAPPYEVRPNGYPVAGSDQDWYRHAHGTLAYIVEGTHHNPPLAVRARSVAATRPLWETLLERAARGPRISGRIRASDGRPLAAVIRIDEIRTQAGEQWTSRARDGRFDRIVIGPGRYTVRVSAPGHAPWQQVVRVVRGPIELDVVLDQA